MNLRYFLANVCVNAIKSELNGDLRLENNETCSILYGFKRSLSYRIHPYIPYIKLGERGLKNSN